MDHYVWTLKLVELDRGLDTVWLQLSIPGETNGFDPLLTA